MKKQIIDYFIRVGDAFSQLINVVVFFGDNPNESVSGRAYRQRSVWYWNAIRVSLNFVLSVFEEDHCKKSHEADISRAARLLRSCNS